MPMTPFFRKFGLTAHITFSVGWFGAVAGFLALAIAGLTNQNAQIVLSCYLSMELIAWFIIVPASLGSFLTGLIQSWGTKWGLFLHYWVVLKFLLTIIATVILLLHMQPISYMADMASGNALSDADLRGLRIQIIADAGAALFILLVAITLSIYKPWGRTPYGMQKLNERPKNVSVHKSTRTKPWILYVLLGLICLVILLFIVMHLTGAGLGKH
jgi:hypothetical protein